MKQTLLIITFLLSGYLQNFAQNYETFVTEMKKLEQEEKEYSGILFRKNDYSAEYKKGFEPKLKKVREEKVTLARKAIEANPDDKRFVDVLNFYLFNYLSIEELDRMLDRFTADARQHPMWKSMKSYVTYKPLNAVGHKAFDFTVKGHDGKKITLSKVLKKNKVVLVDFWASWCGPCRMQSPIIDQLAAAHSNVVFGKVNVDEEADLAAEYGITSIPTLIIFSDGRLINQVTGVTSKASLERMLGL